MTNVSLRYRPLKNLQKTPCGRQPCQCLGFCLQHSTCSQSGVGMPPFDCTKVTDKAPETTWFGELHQNFLSLSESSYLDAARSGVALSLTDVGGGGGGFSTPSPPEANGNNDRNLVVGWVSVTPYYAGQLAGSYTLSVDTTPGVLSKAPSSWDLFAGEEGSVGSAAGHSDPAKPLVLIDQVRNFDWQDPARVREYDGKYGDKKFKVAVFELEFFSPKRGLVAGSLPSADDEITRDDNVVFQQRRLLPAVTAKTWRYYRLEILRVQGAANLHGTQPMKFPVQAALSEFDLFPYGGVFELEVGAWGACSRPCGGGEQSRIVACRNKKEPGERYRGCGDFCCLVENEVVPAVRRICGRFEGSGFSGCYDATALGSMVRMRRRFVSVDHIDRPRWAPATTYSRRGPTTTCSRRGPATGARRPSSADGRAAASYTADGRTNRRTSASIQVARIEINIQKEVARIEINIHAERAQGLGWLILYSQSIPFPPFARRFRS